MDKEQTAYIGQIKGEISKTLQFKQQPWVLVRFRDTLHQATVAVFMKNSRTSNYKQKVRKYE